MAAGYRSFEAFWIGGAGGFDGIIPPPVPPVLPVVDTGGGGTFISRRPVRASAQYVEDLIALEELREQKLREDDEILLVIVAILKCRY